MLPPSLLPELYTQGSLDRLAHSALPGAPVRPPVARSRRLHRAVGRQVARLGRRPAASTPRTSVDRCGTVPGLAR